MKGPKELLGLLLVIAAISMLFEQAPVMAQDATTEGGGGGGGGDPTEPPPAPIVPEADKCDFGKVCYTGCPDNADNVDAAGKELLKEPGKLERFCHSGFCTEQGKCGTAPPKQDNCPGGEVCHKKCGTPDKLSDAEKKAFKEKFDGFKGDKNKISMELEKDAKMFCANGNDSCHWNNDHVPICGKTPAPHAEKIETTTGVQGIRPSRVLHVLFIILPLLGYSVTYL